MLCIHGVHGTGLITRTNLARLCKVGLEHDVKNSEGRRRNRFHYLLKGIPRTKRIRSATISLLVQE
jgi:hypothetical protein